MSDRRTDFMRDCNDSFVKHCTGGSSTGLPAQPQPIATDHSVGALKADPMTAALSHATAAALGRALDARSTLHLITLDYAARLLRGALPDAAAITVDTEDGELFEVRDASGKALYRAPFTPASPLCDGLADDVSDLFRQAFPLGGLAGAGWEVAAEGEPYRSILLPTGTQRGTAATHFPASRAHGEIRAEYAPGGNPAFELDSPDDGGCIRETRDRIRAAIVNSGLEWQPGRMRITAHWTITTGHSADLVIACTALAAAGAVDPAALNGVALIGELGLDGRVRPVYNVTAAVRMAQAAGYRKFIVAADDFDKISRNPDITPVGANDLRAALGFLQEMHETPTIPTAADTRPHGTPGEDAGPCAQCDRPLIWDATGKRVNDEWGEYLCYGPRRAGGNVHVLAG
ncbi:magnesium chelatase domain-containing protein [Streptomyces sp. NPDC086782]|uniref:magnesium chelatase domain-containing protein n=1 Tax=Streptomyces sp. NPDC086782 TaxID=3365757 RepID=UPI0037F4010A